jgi:DNA-binding transcriptional MerR regulator
MKSFDAGGAGVPRPIFSISAVARMLGVPVATIRTWEDRYGLVVPDRNASGHRLYRRDQVEQLRFVHDRMAEGLSAADAHRLLAEWLDQQQPERADPVRPGPAIPPQPGQAERAAGHQVAVLLAERDPYAAELQEQHLTTEGFAVEVALTEKEALGALAARPPAVAVIEILISGGTGLDLCRAVKQHGVPVIATSVLRAHDEALGAGADVFLAKPLDPTRLATAVRGLLGLSRQQRSRQEAAS